MTRRAGLLAGLGRRRLSSHGMLAVLLLLVALFSLLTVADQHPTGAAAAERLAGRLLREAAPADPVLVAARGTEEGRRFVAALAERLRAEGRTVAGEVAGEPGEIRAAAEALAAAGGGAPWIATTEAGRPAVEAVRAALPGLARARIAVPAPRRWPTFLLKDNLRNVAGQIAVIAILAVGMTLVILTGGIDLSVGSLIALSAVVCAWLIGRLGGAAAGPGALLLAGAGAVALSAAAGAFSGLTIVRFRLPPFIATLAMMQVASGLAYILSRGRPIYDAPESFTALGRGVDPLLGVPWAVWLMLALYAAGHLLTTRTALGRHIYAVGGNEEAARLAGVRTGAVLLFVYTACGALAGVGGVAMASQLRSGAPTYGLMYELYVIAAVVVGGTSLSGGEGRVFGTLVGAFIIAVIQNGMNLVNVESYTQKVVLGLVILGAVLLDKIRRR